MRVRGRSTGTRRPPRVTDPLILADEPTAHLDHVQAEGVLRLLRELASGERIVVVATHDTRIMPFADRAVRLPDFSAIDSEPETVRVASGSVLFEQASSPRVRARTDAIVTGYTVEAFHRLLQTYAERSLIEHHEMNIEQENTEHDHRDLGDAALPTGHR